MLKLWTHNRELKYHCYRYNYFKSYDFFEETLLQLTGLSKNEVYLIRSLEDIHAPFRNYIRRKI